MHQYYYSSAFTYQIIFSKVACTLVGFEQLWPCETLIPCNPQEEEEEEENHLSDEAERRFDEQHSQEGQQAKTEQPEATASFVNVTFELEQESHATPDANKVPAPIPS